MIVLWLACDRNPFESISSFGGGAMDLRFRGCDKSTLLATHVATPKIIKINVDPEQTHVSRNLSWGFGIRAHLWCNNSEHSACLPLDLCANLPAILLEKRPACFRARLQSAPPGWMDSSRGNPCRAAASPPEPNIGRKTSDGSPASSGCEGVES